MTAKQYLASKGIFGLDTKKRYNEVITWMEEYASEFIKGKDYGEYWAIIHAGDDEPVLFADQDWAINTLTKLLEDDPTAYLDRVKVGSVAKEEKPNDSENRSLSKSLDSDDYLEPVSEKDFNLEPPAVEASE